MCRIYFHPLKKQIKPSRVRLQGKILQKNNELDATFTPNFSLSSLRNDPMVWKKTYVYTVRHLQTFLLKATKKNASSTSSTFHIWCLMFIRLLAIQKFKGLYVLSGSIPFHFQVSMVSLCFSCVCSYAKKRALDFALSS